MIDHFFCVLNGLNMTTFKLSNCRRGIMATLYFIGAGIAAL